MIYKNKKLLFLLITIFLLGFQSVSLAHHDNNDDINHSNVRSMTKGTPYSSESLGKITKGSSVTPGHPGYTTAVEEDFETGQLVNQSYYQDYSDVWKIANIQRGDKITIDLYINSHVLTPPLEPEQFDFELAVYDPISKTVDEDDPNYRDPLNMTDMSNTLGYGPDNSQLVTHKRLVITANLPGTYYINVTGYFDFFFDETYGSTGRPYSLKASWSSPTQISAINPTVTGGIAEYPPVPGVFNTPENYYYLSNLASTDKVTLTIRSTSSASGLNVRTSAYKPTWGAPIATTDFANYGFTKSVTFSPGSSKIFIYVGADGSEGNYSLSVKVTRKSTISITSPSTLRYPGSGKIYGRITRDGKTYPSGVAVKLYHKPYGKSWSLLKTVSTNQYGNYTFTGIKPDRLTQYYVSWAGDPSSTDFVRYAGAKSATKVTKVYPSLNIAASRTSLYLGNVTTISGKLGPAAGHKGKIIYIQMYNTATRKWSGIGSAKLSSTGVYNFTWKPTLKGRHKLRAYFGGDADHLAKSSSYKYISAL